MLAPPFVGGGYGGHGDQSQLAPAALQEEGSGFVLPESTSGQGSQKMAQTCTPCTIRMILEAFENVRLEKKGVAPDATYIVSGRPLGVTTIIGSVDDAVDEQVGRRYLINDGTGRLSATVYQEYNDAGGQGFQKGDFVRAFGNVRSFQDKPSLNTHFIAKITNSNEIAHHFIEVAHVHLSCTGRLVKGTATPQQGAPRAIPVQPASMPPLQNGPSQTFGQPIGQGPPSAALQQLTGQNWPPPGTQVQSSQYGTPSLGVGHQPSAPAPTFQQPSLQPPPALYQQAAQQQQQPQGFPPPSSPPNPYQQAQSGFQGYPPQGFFASPPAPAGSLLGAPRGPQPGYGVGQQGGVPIGPPGYGNYCPSSNAGPMSNGQPAGHPGQLMAGQGPYAPPTFGQGPGQQGFGGTSYHGGHR